MSVAVPNTYQVKGSVLDVYHGVPFWVRQKTENQSCISVTSWLIDQGEIAGVRVSGTAVVTINTKLPYPGGFDCKRLILIDEDAAPEVVRWVVDAFQGRLGGPLGELAKVSGAQVGFYQVPICYRLEESSAIVSVPDKVKVIAAGRRICQWHPAGSAAPWQRGWIGQGSEMTVRFPEFQMVFSLPETRAVRGCFLFLC